MPLSFRGRGMSKDDFTITRRTAVRTGLFAVGAAVAPGVASGETGSDQKFVPGYDAREPPSDSVDISVVSPLIESKTVPTGNFIDHSITLLGGTRKAAEWWQTDTTVTFTIEGEETENLVDSEYAAIEQRDEVELVDGTVVEDVWVVDIAYITNPQSPGEYELNSYVDIPTRSPSRGDVLTRIGPATLRIQGSYTVEPRGKN